MWELKAIGLFALVKALNPDQPISCYEDFADNTVRQNCQQIQKLGSLSSLYVKNLSIFRSPMIGNLNWTKYLSDDFTHRQMIVELQHEKYLILNLILEKFEVTVTESTETVQEFIKRRPEPIVREVNVNCEKTVTVDDIVRCLRKIQTKTYHLFDYNCGVFNNIVLSYVQGKATKCEMLAQYLNQSDQCSQKVLSKLNKFIEKFGVYYMLSSESGNIDGENCSYFSVKFICTDTSFLKMNVVVGENEKLEIQEADNQEGSRQKGKLWQPVFVLKRPLDFKQLVKKAIQVYEFGKSSEDYVNDFYKELTEL